MTEPGTIEYNVPCIRCGYDLRGMSVAGDCPKCGHLATESLAASRSITKREIAFLACRIIALWIIVMGMHMLVAVVGVVLMLLFDSNSNSVLDQWIYMVIYIVTPIVIGLSLWFLSSWCSHRMIAKDGVAIPTQSWTAADLMTTAVMVFGLYLTVTGLQTLVAVVLRENMVAPLPTMFDGAGTGGVGNVTVRIIFGLLLIAGRQRLGRWVHKARTAGSGSE